MVEIVAESRFLVPNISCNLHIFMSMNVVGDSNLFICAN